MAENQSGTELDRRNFLSWLSRIAMVGGLVAAYGTLAGFMGRFLYPARETRKGWMFVTQASALAAGEALRFETPAGASVNVARQGMGDDDFIALSSTCPHLGCQVHWEAQNDRFFCPCHNGVFEPGGKAIGGPPAEAGQSLLRYPLKVEKGALYIELPTEVLAQGEGRVVRDPAPARAGHDPCLTCRPQPGVESRT
jgi:cytochrome b6-f complex iron-sulfur subunit